MSSHVGLPCFISQTSVFCKAHERFANLVGQFAFCELCCSKCPFKLKFFFQNKYFPYFNRKMYVLFFYSHVILHLKCDKCILHSTSVWNKWIDLSISLSNVNSEFFKIIFSTKIRFHCSCIGSECSLETIAWCNCVHWVPLFH